MEWLNGSWNPLSFLHKNIVAQYKVGWLVRKQVAIPSLNKNQSNLDLLVVAKMQQAVRSGFCTFRSSILSNGAQRFGVFGSLEGCRGISSQSAACSAANIMDKEEVTTRLIDLLKSIPFVDPSKVSPSANLKDDLQLDTLDSAEVMMAVEEEFAVDISDTEADKFSTTAHLIDYIATHPQAK